MTLSDPYSEAWKARKRAEREVRRKANQAASAERVKALTEIRKEQREQRGQAKRAMSALERKLASKPSRQQDMLDLRLMSDAQLLALHNEIQKAERYDWRGNARPEQIKPDDFLIWLLLCGRGWGKTRAMVEAVREYCETPMTRVAVVSKDHRQLRDVLLEGVSGFVSCIPPEEIAKIHKGLGDVSVDLVNGSTIKMYTAGEPDAVRGQSFDVIVGDEFAAWPKNKAQEMLDMLRMCQRESKAGSVVILATTPKRIPHVMDMLKLAEDPEERIVIARGTSRDNKVLTAEWHRIMERRYGGTRLGRQEIGGEMVLDNERALWSGRMIDESRWDPQCNCKKDTCDCNFDIPKLVGVMTGVDPSGSKDGDPTGIVTAGWDKNKQIYVLDNPTTDGDPGVRYRAVCLSAFKYGSGEIWYESAYGGDNAAYGIQETWKTLQREGTIPATKSCPPCKPSTIKGDKAARAMPVVALYEQQVNLPTMRNIWHDQPSLTNNLAKLEDELLIWETDAKKSPNAMDALVHCVRAIMRKTGREVHVGSPASPHSTRRIRTGYNPYGTSR